MRFVAGLWSLIFASLLLFTVLLFSHELLSLDLPTAVLKGGLLAGTWILGLASATAIHMLFRRTEAALQQAARDQTVAQMAGAVAHELNQPLTVLITSGELLCNHEHSADEMRTVARRMIDASQRVSDIVEKLRGATHYHSKEYVGGVQIVDLDRAS